jgi:hypothetical protein
MLEVTGSNPGPGKINLIIIEKNTNGIRDSKKSTFLRGIKGCLS